MTMIDSHEVFSGLVALGPLAIGIYVAYIARQQWRTAQQQALTAAQQSETSREKFRLDLYDRRFAVYERSLAFYYAVVVPSENPGVDEWTRVSRAFVTSVRESRFLFKPESGISTLLEEVRAKSQLIRGWRESGQLAQQAPDTYIKMTKDATAALEFLQGALVDLESRLMEYLDFGRVLK
jgi:hypothetical protein